MKNEAKKGSKQKIRQKAQTTPRRSEIKPPLQVRCGRVRKRAMHRTKGVRWRRGPHSETAPAYRRQVRNQGRAFSPGVVENGGELAKKASAADAQVLLQLYELRREAEMRKARQWWLAEFWPRNADEFAKVAMTPATQENAWLRHR